VHLAGEYWPYARTGGLAEAVRGIARAQAHAGRPTLVFMPLYRRALDHFPEIEPLGEPFEVRLGLRTEAGRIHHVPAEKGEPHVLFVEHEGFFGRPELYGPPGGAYDDNHLRYGFFCRAVLAALPEFCPGECILHLHDWHTALAAIYLGTVLKDHPDYAGVSTVLSVHNAGYQQDYDGSWVLEQLGLPLSIYNGDQIERYGRTNLLKGGLNFSDMVTTVSPNHAHELRTHMGGFGLDHEFRNLLDRFGGILNGIDYEVWDPETDPAIPANFSAAKLEGKGACKTWLQEASGLEPRTDVPILAMSARLVHQKGLDLILGDGMIPRTDAQWIFLGQGEPRYKKALQALADAHPDRVAVRFDFTEDREHKLMAGADLLLMPSLYEPCGLTQMRAQRYGALPVVRRVGGLADTVEDRVTGFVFDEYEPWALEEALQSALDLYKDQKVWRWHVREAMGRDFSWGASVERYRLAYRRAVDHHFGLD
jgi:starch synthase